MKKQLIQTLQNKFVKGSTILVIVCVSLSACSKNDVYNNTNPGGNGNVGASVLSAVGDSSTIVGTVNVFRNLLGDSLNTTPSKTSGRREINWDAVPPTFTNLNNFPGNFFNSTIATDPAARKRGLVLINSTAFRVDSTAFAEVDNSYANQFQIFSKKRLFVNTASNITTVTFKVAGTSTDAFIHGFGVIFSDVDDDNSTSLEFFDGNKSLGVFKASAHPASGSFSFLGVKFKDAKVTSVKITSGNGNIAQGIKDVSNGGANDLVVMDDFLYSEPVANQ